ncbi:hypothetical protein A3A66_00305 [Microgenomates group bacterium RIFCSPLOWO2_01_FULL_46_13]|nr:MAG: hypothetical protein A2783_03825 [Microgenomates group bacterium RIFCSPHIGHO2_01_FULL_45_11]OGV94458.1 MAG: hypothetical protein A3A66_00305 [Microgenomates group bacterium RIFCSPLOWO2_01_FULL_46_13]
MSPLEIILMSSNPDFAKVVEKAGSGVFLTKGDMEAWNDMAPGLRGQRVVIVDDKRISLDTIERWLITVGVDEVTPFANASGALEFLQSVAAADLPDVVITDIQMPGMNGIELAKKLRELFPKQ